MNLIILNVLLATVLMIKAISDAELEYWFRQYNEHNVTTFDIHEIYNIRPGDVCIGSDRSNQLIDEWKINETEAVYEDLVMDDYDNDGKTNIYILDIGLTSSVSRLIGQLALDLINNDSNILDGYRLNIIAIPTGCDPGKSVSEGFKQLLRLPVKLAVIGLYCSTSTIPVAESMQHWNMLMMSLSSSAPVLSDRTRYSTFYRIEDSDGQIAEPLMEMCRTYNWKHVAIIHQAEEIFTSTANRIVQVFEPNNISISTVEIFRDSPDLQVLNLKNKDARIIIMLAHGYQLEAIACQAYKNGLYGGNYVWVSINWAGTAYWIDRNETCTSWEKQLVVNRSLFTVGGIKYNDDLDLPTLSGLTTRQFINFQKLMDENGFYQSYKVYTAQWFDTIFATALMLNSTIKEIEPQIPYLYGEKGKPLIKKMMKAMDQVEFNSISKGLVGFGEGDVVADKRITQVHVDDGTSAEKRVAVYRVKKQMEGKLVFLKDNAVEWAKKKIPVDKVKTIVRDVFISHIVYGICCTLAILGVSLSIGLITFNILRRKVRVIKMSSPNINTIILVGCGFAYLFVLFEPLEKMYVVDSCSIKSFILASGFSLSFGGLFAKMWRVFFIFTSKKVERRKSLGDRNLFQVIVALLMVNLIILMVQQVTEPPTLRDKEVVVSESDEVIEFIRIYFCDRKHSYIYTGVLLTIHGLLLIFGCFLSFQTRKVHFEALNDSQSVGLCIYNVLVLAVLGVILNFLVDMSSAPTTLYVLNSSVVILASTATQLILFLPKFLNYNQVSNRPTTFGSHVSPSITGNEENKDQIAEQMD